MAAELEATVRDVNPGGGLNGNFEDIADVDQSTITAHKNALEMYAFLLLWVVGVGEKVSGKDEDGAAAASTKGKRTTAKGTKAAASKPTKKKASSWTWVDQIPSVLSLLSKVLKSLPSSRVWTSTAERDGFIG